MSTVHVYPVNDLIQHLTEGSECPCGPVTQPVRRIEDGYVGWMVVHNSLDGREFNEPGGPKHPPDWHQLPEN